MTNEEIQNKINENNKKIESLMSPAQFVLNNEINQLLEENNKLRQQCTHQYVNHICIYCGSEENN